jgi:hypothetical protein
MKFLVPFFLIVTFYSKAQSIPNHTDGLDTLISKPLKIDMPKYSIELPQTWEIKPGCLEEQCTANSPGDTIGGYDMYIESINLTVNKLSSTSYTAEKYATFSIGYLPKVVQEFKVLQKAKLSASSYRVTYTGVKNNFRQVWRQYYHVKSGKVYIVTFSAEAKKYNNYSEMIEPYLASFKFK